MLIFIDESWQTINGTKVAALGAVAVPTGAYNRLCTKFFAMKHNVLGAEELADKEIKAGVNLTKAQFTRLQERGSSDKLQAVEETFDILAEYRARTFAVWTTVEEHLPLRCENSTTLALPYAELLYDLKRMMQQNRSRGRSASSSTRPHGAGGARGQLYFDQRSHAEDLAMACAVQNFLMRTGYHWRRAFLQVPHFTLSAVSPGLQAADLVAYLAAQQIDPTARPELAPYWNRVQDLQFNFNGKQDRPALRLVA